MPTSSFLRQISSSREAWRSTSNRWGFSSNFNSSSSKSLKQMEGYYSNMHSYSSDNGLVMRKRVMVVVDNSSYSKHAMMWALTHSVNKGDLLTLLHIIPNPSETPDSSSSTTPYLANSLGSLCKACKPEVEVEALVIQGPRLATVMNQVKKLDVSVLVLGQKKPSSLLNCLCGTSSSEEFVEQCINNVECLTIGVSKQSKSVGGYLISTRWKKNFWLLA
ncbi:uncharacterized protein LOC126655711 [Mercurialis annua]|uniref:uncharacterized protein LOC126655711 n=1 Tax=Mercurialis annua TaxID=3986 RepID=UPI00215F534F|nr:uncharacterized protein LOC126655711 [Mercurialis annua]